MRPHNNPRWSHDDVVVLNADYANMKRGSIGVIKGFKREGSILYAAVKFDNGSFYVATDDLASQIREADYDDFISPAKSDPKGDGTYKPQSDMLSAPERVDTLRTESLCPNCKADHLQDFADGVSRCPTCGYEPPPDPLDNPDLSLAPEFNQQQDSTDKMQGLPSAEVSDSGAMETDVNPVSPTVPTKTII
jgi:hypothetical protein